MIDFTCKTLAGLAPEALRYTALETQGALLFESARIHALYGTRSLLCAGALVTYRVPWTGNELVRQRADGSEAPVDGNPLRALAQDVRLIQQSLPSPGKGVPPAPVLAGYLAYDAGRFAEKMPAPQDDGPGFPDIFFVVPEAAALHIHEERKTFLYGMGRNAEKALASLEEALTRAERPEAAVPQIASLSSNFAREPYLDGVRRVKKYIAAGDIYQANLSQQFRADGLIDARAVYLDLAERSPAPFFAWLDVGDGRFVLSSSMELFLTVEAGKVITRPIKGTRPRGDTPEDDLRLENELRASIKDKAELTMIVDLERNDLGRVCDYGTVRVPSLHYVESHPHVHHMVATVEGKLHEGMDIFDLLVATFPGGSITGAPKVRSMEIIRELEPTRRSVYCGSIGFIDAAGSAAFNIAIRTMLIEGNAACRQAGAAADPRCTAWFSVGGGLTSDSDPEAEYQETLDKARGMALALNLPWPPQELASPAPHRPAGRRAASGT